VAAHDPLLDVLSVVFFHQTLGSMMNLEFPSDWPDDCPPADAVDAEGCVYRIVKHDVPKDEDFQSHHETGRLRNAHPCLRCGLSVFRDIQDAIHQKQLFPKLGEWIARGALKAEHGMTKVTPTRLPTHTTWWPYSGVQRKSLFAVVRGFGHRFEQHPG
jgi:hypothetical protein